MNISTKTGDKGETSLFGGQRVKKSDIFMRVLGELDELNSFLGLAKCSVSFDVLEKIQDDIYRIMAIVGNKFEPVLEATPVGDSDVFYLEENIENFEKICGKIDKFVMPGKDETSARLHVARSVCRRAERAFVEMLDSVSLEGECVKNSENILKYLNRLSDLLFLMAILHKK
ncbi:MAG: cob(I)yrinic acid a,c-diamide adenosyltransferase [Candidatus Peregrinibacteria bacterium]|nr:cob(I)yrinic acid a,c-diamide adenosyltransferase [Candidatus Peregrinibacteria bacterium]